MDREARMLLPIGNDPARHRQRECFCFSDQTLAAGEEREMPVVFRVKSDAPESLGTISISYTFFEAPAKAP